ncbi:hypothetical protein [Pseudomonas aeruginosa]|uniref:hypothetical protein n=1 Tax=Pseudomonas aeruginosa TaxID=287 RepID=UPI00128F8F2C
MRTLDAINNRGGTRNSAARTRRQASRVGYAKRITLPAYTTHWSELLAAKAK